MESLYRLRRSGELKLSGGGHGVRNLWGWGFSRYRLIAAVVVASYIRRIVAKGLRITLPSW